MLYFYEKCTILFSIFSSMKRSICHCFVTYQLKKNKLIIIEHRLVPSKKRNIITFYKKIKKITHIHISFASDWLLIRIICHCFKGFFIFIEKNKNNKIQKATNLSTLWSFFDWKLIFSGHILFRMQIIDRSNSYLST